VALPNDIGVLMLDNDLPRPVGDVGNPATFSFGVAYTTIAGAGTRRVVEERAAGLGGNALAALRRLTAEGVRAVSTCCGYLAILQRELAAASTVPVATSSLLQVPVVLRMLRPDQKVCVVTVDATSLSAAHLFGAGVAGDEVDRVVLAGLEGTEHFHPMIVGRLRDYDPKRGEAEVVAAACQAVRAEPSVGAFVFECTNLPPYSAAVRAATGLPVWDATTLIEWLHAGVAGPSPAR
jgi:hypothetical protein